jgi:hypothetical protein|tara:strand:- start:1224 stop:1478 length:255 start_codon:yes stop_codon:yes gene_type:complete
VNWLEILEKYGIPLVVAVAMFMMVKQQNNYIQNELSKELRESFNRIEGILIKLIDNSKKAEIKQEGLIKSYKSLVEIITRILNK